MNTYELSEPPVLLVDDEQDLLLTSRLLLRSRGISPVDVIQDSRKVLAYLEHQPVSAIVLDLSMPHVSGSELLPQIRAQCPDTPVIMMTAVADVQSAIDCMKLGAYDYLIKPVDETRFISCVKRAMELNGLRQQIGVMKDSLLNSSLRQPDVFAPILTQSTKMRGLFQYMEAIAASSEPVLITGETGVGKELFAQAMHRLSGRSGPLVTANIAGLDDTLFSDTLFGHQRGAFTGAESIREGLVAKAAGGTLFLDEIGDLSASSQVKLLRLLQDKSYFQLGSDSPKNTDVRVIVATHQSLPQIMSEGKFRSDLYYRLDAHQIHIPAIRDRAEDIPLLVSYFLKQASQAMHKATPTPPPELHALLANYPFPGNVRELRSMIFDAVAQHDTGILSMRSFRGKITNARLLATTHSGSLPPVPPLFATTRDSLPTLKEAEQWLIDEALRRSDNNQGIAAGLLGISRQALNRRLTRAVAR